MANDRDCENCKHHREVRKNGKFYRFCESWDCGFEPKEPVRNPDQLDCISRQAVLDLLENTNNGWIINEILQLPPVNPQEPKTDWIPVSEDLPKDAYGCIVTVLDVDLRTQNEFENILPYFVGYDGETWNNAGGEPIPYEVIAWMKAPEPYKAESEET